MQGAVWQDPEPKQTDGHPDNWPKRASPGDIHIFWQGRNKRIIVFFTIFTSQEISGLEKGIEYEFRVAGVNNVGPGQVGDNNILLPTIINVIITVITVIKIIINYSLAGNDQVLLDPRRRANGCTEEHHLEVPDPRCRGDRLRRTPRCSFDGGGGDEEDWIREGDKKILCSFRTMS